MRHQPGPFTPYKNGQFGPRSQSWRGPSCCAAGAWRIGCCSGRRCCPCPPPGEAERLPVGRCPGAGYVGAGPGECSSRLAGSDDGAPALISLSFWCCDWNFRGAFDASVVTTALTPAPGRFSIGFGLNKPGASPSSPYSVSRRNQLPLIKARFSRFFNLRRSSVSMFVPSEFIDTGRPFRERSTAAASGVSPSCSGAYIRCM